jgi:hypothetical protein
MIGREPSSILQSKNKWNIVISIETKRVESYPMGKRDFGNPKHPDFLEVSYR